MQKMLFIEHKVFYPIIMKLATGFSPAQPIRMQAGNPFITPF